MGDKLLQLFAQRLAETLRETDCCGRTDGEKFICILPETELLEAEQLVERN